MRILFVSLFLPLEQSYHAGGRYVFEVIRNLSQRHEVCLAARVEEEEVPLLSRLRPFCREIYPYKYRTKEKRGLFDFIGLILNYVGFSRYARKIAGSGGYDIVQVEWTEAAIMMKGRRGIPMVLDAHDVITKPAERRMKSARGPGRLFHLLRYFLIKKLEAGIAKRFDIVFTRSAFDRDYLLGLEPGLKVSVVPHPAGLDITEKQFEKEKDTILFLASYKYRRTNVDAALFFYRSVFPLVRERFADAKFIITGSGPPEELTSLAAADPAVSVTGFVEDIDRVYKRATVFVAPILVGGGIIVKVLDAMAAGTPVVATSYANEGIGAIPGRDLLVADDAREMADAVVRILGDRELAHRLGESGRQFVRIEFSRETVMAKVERAYEELIRERTL